MLLTPDDTAINEFMNTSIFFKYPSVVAVLSVISIIFLTIIFSKLQKLKNKKLLERQPQGSTKDHEVIIPLGTVFSFFETENTTTIIYFIVSAFAGCGISFVLYFIYFYYSRPESISWTTLFTLSTCLSCLLFASTRRSQRDHQNYSNKYKSREAIFRGRTLLFAKVYTFEGKGWDAIKSQFKEQNFEDSGYLSIDLSKVISTYICRRPEHEIFLRITMQNQMILNIKISPFSLESQKLILSNLEARTGISIHPEESQFGSLL